jgi:hypothetical protein
MDKELIQLLEKVSGLPDDDLIRMVNVDFSNYRPEALSLARAVMSKRGFTVDKKGRISGSPKSRARKRQSKPVGDPLPPKPEALPAELNRLLEELLCSRCDTPLEYVGTRRLHEDKSLAVLAELGDMFKSGAPEFLDVYICRHCGRVDLFVDGVGEEFRPY